MRTQNILKPVREELFASLDEALKRPVSEPERARIAFTQGGFKVSDAFCARYEAKDAANQIFLAAKGNGLSVLKDFFAAEHALKEAIASFDSRYPEFRDTFVLCPKKVNDETLLSDPSHTVLTHLPINSAYGFGL